MAICACVLLSVINSLLSVSNSLLIVSNSVLSFSNSLLTFHEVSTNAMACQLVHKLLLADVLYGLWRVLTVPCLPLC